MKKMISLFLVLAMCTALCVPALALEYPTEKYAYIQTDGNIEAITAEEYEKLLAVSTPVGISYSFAEDTSKTRQYFGEKVFVSPVGEPGGIITASYSHTVTAEFGVDLEYEAKIKILQNLTFSGGLKLVSATGAESAYSYPIPAGQYARITWQANMRHVEGTLTTTMLLETGQTVTVPQHIEAEIPVKLPNGLADGVFGKKVASTPEELAQP